ncbi:MAG TPA: twin-arginine translocase TatA/TatE family subunit [Thermoanaerobaculia bacterium]|jgi:sec-independent protein translocase protein TatA
MLDWSTGAVIGFIGGLGMGELLVILFIVLVIFGASKLPQLGRGLGEGISNFKEGLRGKDEPRRSLDEKKDNG